MRYTTLLTGALSVSVACLAVPASAAAQDTTRTREVATGEIESARIDNRGLTQTQVERLQQRLNEIGCEAGPVDGLIGPRTREAISCARRQENITGTDIQSVMRGLGLEEGQQEPMTPPRDTVRDTTPMRDTTMMMRDTSMMRDTMMRDTTMRMRVPMDTMRRDSLRLQQDTMRRDTMPRTPRDTIGRDTTRIPRDTIRDTLPPVPPAR